MVASEGASEREDRIDAAIEEYLAAVEGGEPFDEDELLERYPDAVEELRAFIARERGLGRRIAETAAESGVHLPLARELGDYELIDVIAVGGMGVVHRARQKSLGRLVALKTLAAGRVASAEMVRRFDREVRASARLDHPNIVPIYEVGESDGVHYFSMRLVEGGNLADRRADFRGREQGAVRLLETVARAVHDAHLKGVLHRDLKPANILLDESGVPFVTDFGLAKVMDDGHTLTQSGAIVGTIKYMSPEQAAGTAGQLTPAADVYSLGVILYELLAGEPPFRGDSSLAVLRAVQEQQPPPLKQANGRVSRDLETIVLKCLEKDPRRRYASAGALADDLQRLLAGIPVEARRTAVPVRAWRWCLRNRAATAIAVLLVVFAVGASIAATLLARAERQATVSLAGSYLDRARLGISSLAIGRRFASLVALRDSLALRRPASVAEELELRSLAIGALALVDLDPVATVSSGGSDGESRVVSTAFAADLTRAAFGHSSGVVEVRAASEGAAPTFLRGGDGAPVGVRFHNGGRYLGVVRGPSEQPALEVWDLDAGGALQLSARELRSVDAWDFHPSEGRVVFAGRDDRVIVRDLVRGTEQALALEPSPRHVDRLRIDPQGRRFAIASEIDLRQYAVKVFPIGGGEQVCEYANAWRIGPLAWHPEGEFFVAGIGLTVHSVATRTGRRVRLFSGLQSAPTSVAVDLRADLIAATSRDGQLLVWDAKSNRRLVSAESPGGLIFSRDGSRLGARVGVDRLRVWRVAREEECTVLWDGRSRHGQVACLEFSPNGRVLASGGYSGVRLWSTASGNRISQTTHKRPYTIQSVRFIDGGRRFLSWGYLGLYAFGFEFDESDADISRLRFAASDSLRVKPGMTPGNACIDRSERRIALITHPRAGQVTVIDRSPSGAGNQERQVLEAGREISRISMDPEGRWLLAGSSGAVVVWDLDSGEIVDELPADGDVVAFFAPDGRSVLQASAREYRLLTIGSWSELWHRERSNPVGSDFEGRAAFASDGNMIALTDSARDVKLVDSADGRELATLKSSRPHIVRALQFAPDGGWLAVACEDNMIRLWNLRRLRAGLRELGLDWDRPELPPLPPGFSKKIRVITKE